MLQNKGNNNEAKGGAPDFWFTVYPKTFIYPAKYLPTAGALLLAGAATAVFNTFAPPPPVHPVQVAAAPSPGEPVGVGESLQEMVAKGKCAVVRDGVCYYDAGANTVLIKKPAPPPRAS